MHFSTYLALLAAAGTCSAHMAMTNPAPIKSNLNPNTPPGGADYSYTNPLSPSGSDYPCKGYLRLLNGPEGTPVASWRAGESFSLTVAGGATHGGGSCQVSVSVDGGNTFKVIRGYIGGCPDSGAQETILNFNLPGDTPPAERAVVAWTWFNNLGNREMYMNCAVVSISGGGSGGGFSSRPEMFRANTNGCRTADSKDVMFPNPGPDPEVKNPDAVPPIGGDCGFAPGAPGSGSGSGSGSGGGDKGYTPGNDWPEGLFPNLAWSTMVGPEQMLGLLAALTMALCMHYTWFTNLV
ncbi:extracellular protein [Colletotrichum sojae]|uniref:Extracellular protein n=1 Tax=Colletotrichum sojae TaxID=2175907 RepID=A0A8H6MPZ4_9PEZI|nr:extracellular protein [Colletotrichum sojae]